MTRYIDCRHFKGMFNTTKEASKYMVDVIMPMLGCSGFSGYALDCVLEYHGFIYENHETREIWGSADNMNIIGRTKEIFITRKLKYNNLKGVKND